jgi:hypothetical protein
LRWSICSEVLSTIHAPGLFRFADNSRINIMSYSKQVKKAANLIWRYVLATVDSRLKQLSIARIFALQDDGETGESYAKSRPWPDDSTAHR